MQDGEQRDVMQQLHIRETHAAPAEVDHAVFIPIRLWQHLTIYHYQEW
jgi:hypothetical protein